MMFLRGSLASGTTFFSIFFVTRFSTLKFAGHPAPGGNSPAASFARPASCLRCSICTIVARVFASSRGVIGGRMIWGLDFVVVGGTAVLGRMRMSLGRDGLILMNL